MQPPVIVMSIILLLFYYYGLCNVQTTSKSALKGARLKCQTLLLPRYFQWLCCKLDTQQHVQRTFLILFALVLGPAPC